MTCDENAGAVAGKDAPLICKLEMITYSTYVGLLSPYVTPRKPYKLQKPNI